MTTEEYMLEFFSKEQIEDILQYTTNIVNGDNVMFATQTYNDVVRYWSLACAHEAQQRAALESKFNIVKLGIDMINTANL